MTLAGLATAGAVLYFTERIERPPLEWLGTPWTLVGFAAIFVIGSASRGASIPFLVRQSERPAGAWVHKPVPLRTLLVRPLLGKERPLLFMLSFQIAVQISSPFVASYLIVQNGFSNAKYFAAAATLFATKSIAAAIFGSIAARRGARFVLVLSSGLLVAHSILFVLPPHSLMIFMLMSMAGIC